VTLRSFAAALLVIGSSAVARADPEWIALSIDASGGVIVPVSINGQGPYPFLLDTGSSHTVVGRSLAGQLGLDPVARTTVVTSTGSELRPVVRLDQTRIGTARSEGLLASVASSAQLGGIAPGIEGIIGQDFLSGFNYTLDYRTKRVAWTTCAPPERAARLPLVKQAGRYLVQIHVRSGEPPLLLVPDSGANGLVLFERNGRTRVTLAPGAATTSVHSLSGRQDARTMLLRELTLGPVTVRNYPVAVVARDPADVLEGDGLLPLHIFSMATFDAAQHSILLSK
jgi:predicted aspartyl protease